MSQARYLGRGFQAAAVADAAALTSAADQPSTYTEAEVQKLRDDLLEVHTQLNALLASLRAGGVLS